VLRHRESLGELPYGPEDALPEKRPPALRSLMSDLTSAESKRTAFTSTRYVWRKCFAVVRAGRRGRQPPGTCSRSRGRSSRRSRAPGRTGRARALWARPDFGVASDPADCFLFRPVEGLPRNGGPRQGHEDRGRKAGGAVAESGHLPRQLGEHGKYKQLKVAEGVSMYFSCCRPSTDHGGGQSRGAGGFACP
jgi:hypothetical protein